MAFIIAGIYNVLCQIYFFDKQHVPANFVYRENILYSAIFFMCGGLIYLYRENLARKGNTVFGILILMGTALLYYLFSQNDLIMMLFSAAIIIFSITGSGRIGTTKFIKKLSSISF